MADRKPTLDDPDYARFAWKRYRRVLAAMALVATGAVFAAWAWLDATGSGLTLHLAIATAIGVGATIFIAAALMGLVFLSSGTGHDEEVERFDRRDGD